MEGLLSFTNIIGYQSTSSALSTWRGQEREIRESEMNNLKCTVPVKGIAAPTRA